MKRPALLRSDEFFVPGMPACFSRFTKLLLAACLGVSSCALLPTHRAEPPTPAGAPAASSPEVPEAEAPEAEAPAEAASPPPPQNFFQEAADRAQSAVSIGQSAQSPDDWQLAESRWQQAALLMQQVPASDPNHATAQQKVTEYQQNAAQAAKRAQGGPVQTAASSASQDRSSGLVASIPVTDRLGGIPVVSVSLTGNGGTERFPMLFDTGANITLITQSMASQVGVIIVGEIPVIVADGRQVRIPLGYVDTLQVGGLVVRDLAVGIGGDMGLLGQDVYGQYGISAGGSSINLYQ